MSVQVVHYVNQFFAGIGGEAAAGTPVSVRREVGGATRALASALGHEATVVGTIVGGDNHMSDDRERAREAVRAALAELHPDVVIAGPAFESGRYSLACAEVCRVAAEMGIPAVTAMHPGAPGALMYKREILIVPTAATATDMPNVLPRVVRLAFKLARREPLEPAEVEGYLPRGPRQPGYRGEPGWKRALDMLEAKLAGRPYTSEVPYEAPYAVAPAPPVRELSRVAIALVTTGGLVPKGNPDGQVSGNAQRYFRYPIGQLEALRRGEWEAYHVGYFTHLVDQNPNYVLPLGYMREMEKAGVIGSIHPFAYTLPGVSTPVATAQRLGAGIAAELREGQVGGCLLVST
jgi:glycine reductase complex component B subunit gamma